MCGITGFCDFNQSSIDKHLLEMMDALQHRGPNDSGKVLINTPFAQVGLAMRRLSILDLSPLGHQPMIFENLTIVFNGEIYNFSEIRILLEKEGYQFDSGSDTEVILKGYHYWGKKVVDKFIGMFAFVILDKQKNEIVIFRDRAGVKPLYYYYQDNLLLWSSELKSFHKHPFFKKEIDLDSLALYLQYSYVPTPYCIFKHTNKLKPGHYLEIDLNRKSILEHKYWDVFDAYNLPLLELSEKELIQETEKILKSAYEYRMVSDVPVGVFLSGGYDSASVAALLQSEKSEKIRTFTIGFHESKFNEAPEAKKIANFLGTNHTEFYASPKDAKDILPQLPYIYDEPFADNSTIPTILVSKLASNSVKVVLSADGGDEIFGGYHKYQASEKYTKMFPKWMQEILSYGMSTLNPQYLSILNKTYNFSSRYEKMRLIWKSKDPVDAMKYISQYITLSETRSFLSGAFKDIPTFFDEKTKLNSTDTLNNLLAIDYKTFLLDNNLVKVDRATMSVSIEGREPMLDHRLIEFLARIPSSQKIKNGDKKHLLKSIVHKYIPEALMNRPKMPFIAPLTLWFKDELKEQMNYYLSENMLLATKLFNAEPILALKDAYLSGKKVSHQKLWNLLVFQIWYEKWMK